MSQMYNYSFGRVEAADPIKIKYICNGIRHFSHIRLRSNSERKGWTVIKDPLLTTLEKVSLTEFIKTEFVLEE